MISLEPGGGYGYRISFLEATDISLALTLYSSMNLILAMKAEKNIQS